MGSKGNRYITRGTAGLSLVELMIAAGVFSSSMALLSGSMLSYAHHNTISEREAMTTSYNRSVLEDIRGLGLLGILSYEVPLDNPEAETVFIPGTGDAHVSVWAVFPFEGVQTESEVTNPASSRWFLLGEDDPLSVVDPPNPIEIVVEVTKASSEYGQYSEGGIEFSTSTMISY